MSPGVAMFALQITAISTAEMARATGKRRSTRGAVTRDAHVVNEAMNRMNGSRRTKVSGVGEMEFTERTRHGHVGDAVGRFHRHLFGRRVHQFGTGEIIELETHMRTPQHGGTRHG